MLTSLRDNWFPHPLPEPQWRNEAPLVTIAVPAFNRPAFLEQALSSIAAQTVNIPLEVIVCDDGESGEAREVVARYSSDTFRYSKNTVTLGAVGNWNQCIAVARGKWVMVLHDDDALYPWYLECVLPHLSDDSVAVCTMTSRGQVAPRVRPPQSLPPVGSQLVRHFLKSSMTPFPGVLFRRDVAVQLGGFDEKWGPVADYEFWYRLGCAGRIKVVRTVAAFYRISHSQWTARIWKRMLVLTHLLRIRIAAEQFPDSPRFGRWLARFFTYRNSRRYAGRFSDRPEVLRRCLSLGRIPFAAMPSGWVWLALKILSRMGRRPYVFERVPDSSVSSRQPVSTSGAVV